MKVFFALSLAVCIVGVYCEPGIDDHALNECIIEHKADKTIFDEALKTKVIPAKSPEVLAVMGCVMLKEELLTADGKFTKEWMDAPSTGPCRDITGKDNGEIAYKAVECLMKNTLNKKNANTK